MELFTHPNKVNPKGINENDTTLSENHQDSGASLSHGNQPSSLHSPLADASVALEPPPIHPCIKYVNAACLASTFDHIKVRLKSVNDALFSVYQYWVRQKPVTHLGVGIKKDGKWQDRWGKNLVCQHKAMTYRLDMSVKRFYQPFQRSLTAYELGNGNPSR